MKVKLIYNPVSGNGVFKYNLDYIIDRFQSKGIEIVPYRTGNREKMQKVLSSLKEEDYDRIIAAGGDGTVNQVINGLLKNNIDLPLGIIPVGTANDFASYLRLPGSIEEACDIILADNYNLCDVGQINNDYFINIASAGFLIDISQKTDVGLKNTIGKMAYYLKGIEELPNLKPFNIKVQSPDQNFAGEALFLLIMNGKSAGGFRAVAPSASVNDGLLEVIILKSCSLIEFMPLFVQMRTGEHINNPIVSYFRTSELTISCDSKMATDLDGEKGPDFPLNIKCLPQKLKILSRKNYADVLPTEESFNFSDVKKMFEQLSANINVPKPDGQRNVVSDIGKLVKDLPKHNAFIYINKGSLSEEYFEEAEKTLDNGYLYIVLSSTGSAAGETIRRVTKKEYSHASLSFDDNLKTIVSYNGGENIYSPGLNEEMIEFFCQKDDANIIIYKIKASREQKEKVLNEVKNINEQGSSYNVLGLFLPYSHKKNIMFCSQFVYCMLEAAGLTYFEKQPEKVKPTDFVELDYERKLEYCSKLFTDDILK